MIKQNFGRKKKIFFNFCLRSADLLNLCLNVLVKIDEKLTRFLKFERKLICTFLCNLVKICAFCRNHWENSRRISQVMIKTLLEKKIQIGVPLQFIFEKNCRDHSSQFQNVFKTLFKKLKKML